jgi:hypothetical protein
MCCHHILQLQINAWWHLLGTSYMGLKPRALPPLLTCHHSFTRVITAQVLNPIPLPECLGLAAAPNTELLHILVPLNPQFPSFLHHSISSPDHCGFSFALHGARPPSPLPVPFRENWVTPAANTSTVQCLQDISLRCDERNCRCAILTDVDPLFSAMSSLNECPEYLMQTSGVGSKAGPGVAQDRFKRPHTWPSR